MICKSLFKLVLILAVLGLTACDGKNVLTNSKDSTVEDGFENAGGTGSKNGGGGDSGDENSSPSSLSVNSPANISSANASAYMVSGNCDDDLSFVSVRVSNPEAIQIVPCSGGSYTASLDVTAVTSNPAVVTAEQGDTSVSASPSPANDQVPALVAITTSSNIDLSNASSYSFSGTCSEEAVEVTVSVGGISPVTQPTCTGGLWSVTGLDVLGAAEGSLNILADHVDAFGNSASQASVSVNKDMTPFLFWASATQTVGSANINLAADDLDWSGILVSSRYFEIGPVNTDEITIKEAGDYRISLTLPVSSAVLRSNIIAQVKVNSTEVKGAFSASSYIRNDDGHDSSSDHIDFILHDLVANDIVEIQVEQEAAVGAVSISGAAYLFIEPIEDDKVFVATATQVTGGANINSADSLSWVQQKVSSPFAHNDMVNPEQVTFSSAGNYFVSVNIPVNTTVQRGSVKSTLSLGGVAVPGSSARQGYTRAASGHNTASVHWQGILEGVTSGQILEVETSVDALAGTVNVLSGQAAGLTIEKIESTEYISLSGVDVIAGANWNQSSSVDWATQNFIDGANFSHNTGVNSDEITVNTGGNYFISYSGSQTSAAPRAAVTIDVKVNGVSTGLVCDTQYIRVVSGHDESSCSLSGLLQGLVSGDVIRVDTSVGAQVGVVNSNDDSKLFIIKK